MSKFQNTIKNTIIFSGVGIHTGVYTNMKLKPAKENYGIKFIRVDQNKNLEIEANVDNLFTTNRSTSLKKYNIEIHTDEHILAAISGNQIDNVVIEIDNKEIPILDGSSKEFCEKIEEIGVKQQRAIRQYFEISRKIVLEDEDTGTKLIATPDTNYNINVQIDYNSKKLGTQIASLTNLSKFNTEISACRTFCFLHELEEMIEKDLVKGGDLNNAIVIAEHSISKNKFDKIKEVFNNPKIQINENGLLNNIKTRYENEPARHKLLDVIGDLSLVGMPIKGKITAIKPGHKNNTKFAKKLREIMKEQMEKTAPIVDFNKAPLYNKEKIKSILPHREPFLFIDEIREIGDDYIVGIKFVREEEEYFKGHFPAEPVMPGVLQLETMAQTGGVLILNTVKNPQDYLTFFMKIDNAKFKRKVIPGDTIIFKLKLISPIRRGLCHMKGIGFVNNKIVVEAELLAQIAPKNK